MHETPAPITDRTEVPAVSPALQAALGALLIALAVFVAYIPALHGDLIWDDDAYVSENELLVMPGGLRRIWTRPTESPQYYPLVFTSFWLEARLWGLTTLGLHSVNVALHAASAVVLWLLMRKLGLPGAWLAGAIFALHPVHVESVAWITERKNVLSCLFYLLAFAAWIGFYRARPPWRRECFYVGSLVLFVAALLSKTVTCSLPVAILIVHWWRREPINPRLLLRLAPFVVVGVALGLHTALLEKVHVGAEGDEWDLSFIERGLLAGRAVWFYVGKLAWPVNLVFNYPRWTIDSGAVWQYAFPIAYMVVVVLLWAFRDRISRGPLAAVTFFAVTLFPALGFFDVYPFRYSFVADHFQYHASIGMIALGAAILAIYARSPRTLHTLSAAVLTVLGVLTFRQASIYGDVETLWRRTIAANENSWLAHFNLAGLVLRRGDDAGAEDGFRRVLEINPRSADAHWNLGNIAGARGDHDEAMKRYRAALAISPREPTAHYNMAKEWERVGEVDRAIAAYQECLRWDATHWAAHINLGLLLLGKGKSAEAWAHFDDALSYHPNNAAALHNLGMILEREGKYAEAIEYYQRALVAEDTLISGWYRLSVCRRLTGQRDRAEGALRTTLELNPEHPDALADLAVIDYERGRFDDAASGYQRALAPKPGDVQLRINLSATLQRLGRYSDAVALSEAGLKLDANNVALMHHLARLLATAPDFSVRNGVRAVQLAEEAVQSLDPPPPETLATLAAAYAECRDFERAVATIDRAIESARTLNQQDAVVGLTAQRDRYASQMAP